MLLNLFFTYPILSLALNVGAAFYGSIVSYTIFTSRYFHALATAGAIGGCLLTNAALALLTSNGNDFTFIQTNYGGFWGIALAANFWAFVVVGSWILRDRKRPGVYGRLEQSYLEAAADGIMIANLPLSCGVLGGLGMLIQAGYQILMKFMS